LCTNTKSEVSDLPDAAGAAGAVRSVLLIITLPNDMADPPITWELRRFDDSADVTTVQM
jgi:hypothetical protein